MKTKHIFAIALALATLAACDDYTESNFGTQKEMWTPEQVNQLHVTMTADLYQTLSKNELNKALADTLDSAANSTDNTARQQLSMLKRKRRFFGQISPELFIPNAIKELIGNSQYYTITEGTSVTVTLDQEVETGSSENAFVMATGELKENDQYLLVPKGESQMAASLDNPGPLYLTGSALSPKKATMLYNDAFKIDSLAKANAFSISADGDHWLLSNANDIYIIRDTTVANFSYIEDLGDLDDMTQFPLWDITYNEESFCYDIVNTTTGEVVRYDADNDYIVVVPDSLADSFTPIELYRKGQAKEVETTDVTFVLEEGKWVPKSGYLSQIFKGSGSSSTDADYIFNTYGWSIEHEGSIGDLTYVWSYDSKYGLRASAFKSSTRYATKSWAISPAIDLTKATAPVLIFSQAQRYAGDNPRQYLQVWASTNYKGRGMREQAKWKNLSKLVPTYPDGTNWNFVRDTVDLAEFAGQDTIHIAFKYISDKVNAATWEVDSIFVKEKK